MSENENDEVGDGEFAFVMMITWIAFVITMYMIADKFFRPFAERLIS